MSGRASPPARIRSRTTSSSSLRVGAGPGGEDPAEVGDPAPRTEPPDRGHELRNIHTMQRLRPADRGSQHLVVHDRGKVHEGPRGRGDQNTPVPHYIPGVEHRGALHADPRTMPDSVAWHGDLRIAVVPLQES